MVSLFLIILLQHFANESSRGTLSKKERKAYISAVQCFQKKKAKTPSNLIPGAISRFDDWVGTHINQTLGIHYTGTFLAWVSASRIQQRNKCLTDCSTDTLPGLTNSPFAQSVGTQVLSLTGTGQRLPQPGSRSRLSSTEVTLRCLATEPTFLATSSVSLTLELHQAATCLRFTCQPGMVVDVSTRGLSRTVCTTETAPLVR